MSILNLRKSQDKLPKKPRSIKNKLVKAVLFGVSLSVGGTLGLVGTEHLKRKNYDKQTKKEMLKKGIPNNNAKYSGKGPYEDVPFKNGGHDLIWLQEDYIISIGKILKINNIKNSQSILKIIGSIMASEDLLSKDFTVNLRLITDSITDRKLPFIKEFSKSALKVKSGAHEIISKDYELEFISRLADFVIFDKGKKIKLWEHLKKDSKEEFISDFKSGKISTKGPTGFAIGVLMLEYIFEQDYKSSQKINIETLYALYEQKSARRFYKTDLEYLKYANNIDTEKSAITDFRKKINEDLSEIKKQIFLLNINNKKKNLLAGYVDKLINNPTLNIKVVRNKINSVKIIKEKGKEKGKSKKIKAKINQLFLQIESTKNKIPKTRNELIKTKKQENAYGAKIGTVRKDFMQGIYNILNGEDFICARLVSQYAVNINKFRAISLEQFDLNLAIINDNFKNDKDQKLLIIDGIKGEKNKLYLEKFNKIDREELLEEIIYNLLNTRKLGTNKSKKFISNVSNTTFETKYITISAFCGFLKYHKFQNVNEKLKLKIGKDLDNIYKNYIENRDKSEFQEFISLLCDRDRLKTLFDGKISDEECNIFYTQYLIPNLISTLSCLNQIKLFVPEIQKEGYIYQNRSNTLIRFSGIKPTPSLLTKMVW